MAHALHVCQRLTVNYAQNVDRRLFRVHNATPTAVSVVIDQTLYKVR